ncbi:MAG: urease accessory protein UreD [Cyanobacteria bacterium P01_F01_bin.150]
MSITSHKSHPLVPSPLVPSPLVPSWRLGTPLETLAPDPSRDSGSGRHAQRDAGHENRTLCDDAAVVKDQDFYVRVGCARNSQTFVAQQYTAYPFRLSRTFRLDEGSDKQIRDRRAYLYLMNSAPGVFGGDRLNLGLTLEPNAHLYLTDQAATKVHKMPVTDGSDSFAQLSWHITVGAGASLEFVLEPLILYAEAQLSQSTTITLDPISNLFVSEIIVPGRLARSEYYQFREYHNRLRVLSPDGTLLFGDTMRLVGQSNLFKDSIFFAKYPLMANIYTVLPTIDLEQLSHELATNSQLKSSDLLTGFSPLPNCNGLLIKVMGDRVGQIQSYIYDVLSHIRNAKNEPDVPYIPK